LTEVVLFASERSAGEIVSFSNYEYEIQELTSKAFLAETDLALCSAGRGVSRMIRSWLPGTDIVVIDNSSAFRMDPDVPLVVPEINPEAALNHNGYIANPNCSTIQLVMALKPIHDAFGLTRVNLSTYQSVSGAGQSGIDELSAQSTALFNQMDHDLTTFPHQIAFNTIPQIGPFDDNGYTEEEMKATYETRKILGLPDLPVSCTCVRVPTFACHCESVMVETEQEPTVEELSEALAAFPGVRLADQPGDGVYPMNILAVDRDDVLVGRIRKDLTRPRSYLLWVVADNILKGAALNAVQIAELLV
jgi:aspartate-semialdehyde dehydrogenase